MLGVGYDYVDRVLSGDFPLKTVIVLAVLRIVATPVCYSSGNAGGIFGPSLFVGAMMGGAVSRQHGKSRRLCPGGYGYGIYGHRSHTADFGHYDLRDDTGLLHHCPADDLQYDQFFISKKLQPEAIYEALAHQEGVHLPGHGERGSTSGLNAADIMVKSGPMLPSLVGPERLKMELERSNASGGL